LVKRAKTPPAEVTSTSDPISTRFEAQSADHSHVAGTPNHEATQSDTNVQSTPLPAISSVPDVTSSHIVEVSPGNAENQANSDFTPSLTESPVPLPSTLRTLVKRAKTPPAEVTSTSDPISTRFGAQSADHSHVAGTPNHEATQSDTNVQSTPLPTILSISDVASSHAVEASAANTKYQTCSNFTSPSTESPGPLPTAVRALVSRATSSSAGVTSTFSRLSPRSGARSSNQFHVAGTPNHEATQSDVNVHSPPLPGISSILEVASSHAVEASVDAEHQGFSDFTSSLTESPGPLHPTLRTFLRRTTTSAAGVTSTSDPISTRFEAQSADHSHVAGTPNHEATQSDTNVQSTPPPTISSVPDVTSSHTVEASPGNAEYQAYSDFTSSSTESLGPLPSTLRSL
ncbi:hypothetical protein TELCIR_22170, partial [Teladorsagia circumcincta]